MPVASDDVVWLDVLPSMNRFRPELERQVNPAADSAGTQAGGRFTGSFTKALKVGAALGGALAVAGGVGFLKEAISEASDLGESLNAVQVIDPKNAEGINELGRSSAQAFGLSQSQFNGLAVQFSSFATTIAGEGGNVVGTMKDLATRGSDFASVMNLDVNEAMGLFQSGLAGETEPLRAYGIDLSAAAVENYALAKGIVKSGEEMTEAQKVQARYGSLMEQTSKTAGDFTNTSDSLANSQRILGARFDDIQAQVGAKVLPMLERFSGWVLNTGLPALQNFGGWAQDHLIPIFGNIGDFFTNSFLPKLQDLAGVVLPALWTAFQTVGDVVSATVGFFRDHEGAAQALGVVVGTVAGLVVAAWTLQAARSVIASAQSVAAWFATATASSTSAAIQQRSTAQVVVGWVAAAAGATLNAAKIVAAWALSVAQTGVLMAMYAAESVASAARSAAAWVAAQVRTVASLAVTAAGFIAQGAVMVASMVATAASVVAGWVLMGAQSLLQAARMAAAWVIAMGPIALVIAAVVGLVALIIANWDTIQRVTVEVWNAVVGFVKDAASAIWSWVTDRFNSLRDAVAAIWNAVKDFAVTTWNALRDAVVAAAQWVWDRVVQIFNFLRDGVVNIFTALRDAALAVWNFFRDAVVAAAQFIWDQAVRIFGFYRDAVVTIFTALRDAALAVWHFFRDAVLAAAQFIWDGAVRIFNGVKTSVTTIITGTRDAALAVWHAFRDAVVAAAQFIWDGAVRIFTGLKDGAVRVFTATKDTVVGVWNTLRDTVVNGAQNIWDWVTQRFTNMKNTVVGIFETVRDTVGRVWDGLQDKIKAPLRIVFGFINDKMVNPVNDILGKFPGGLRIPSLPGFMTGGYTGDGRRDQVKGVVHAGEYVFTQDQVKRLGLARVEAIASGARPTGNDLNAMEAGGPFDWVGNAWNATGGKVVTAAGNAVDWAAEMAAKGARKVAETLLNPIANAAKAVAPPATNMVGHVVRGFIDKLMSAVLSKGDEQDRAQAAQAAAASAGGGDSTGGGVPAGDGSLGSNWSSLFATIKAIIPQARINSAVRNTNDAHGRGKAVDFGFGSGPGGNGSAGLALINRTLHDRFGKNLYELIYNGIGDDRPNLKNSRPLAYSAAIQAQHRNHVHAAVYDQGGLWEPGTAGFNFTGGIERVLTPPQDNYFRRFVDLSESREYAASTRPPVHLYTPDIPHALRALRAEEQEREALDAPW